MEWLAAMPPGVQVVLYALGVIVGGLGGAIVKGRAADARAVATLADAYSQGFEDMQKRIDHLSGEVERCERCRSEDKQLAEVEQRRLREQHARDVGELQGQISVLERMVQRGHS